MNYWILKSEADCYSIDEMKQDRKTAWSGIRNYQARNFIRDQMNVGDLCLFYHSSAEPTGVYGVVKVVSKAYPDPTQFEKKDDHFDLKSTHEKPLWYVVDVQFVEKFIQPISLQDIKIRPDLGGIMLAQKGSRLSVMPVSEKHFRIIEKLGEK
ncbi:MAG: EVE domain-containing protein [bacterium]|nr:EVE domain-containing protein [bacterium]